MLTLHNYAACLITGPSTCSVLMPACCMWCVRCCTGSPPPPTHTPGGHPCPLTLTPTAPQPPPDTWQQKHQQQQHPVRLLAKHNLTCPLLTAGSASTTDTTKHLLQTWCPGFPTLGSRPQPGGFAFLRECLFLSTPPSKHPPLIHSTPLHSLRHLVLQLPHSPLQLLQQHITPLESSLEARGLLRAVLRGARHTRQLKARCRRLLAR